MVACHAASTTHNAQADTQLERLGQQHDTHIMTSHIMLLSLLALDPQQQNSRIAYKLVCSMVLQVTAAGLAVLGTACYRCV